MIKKLYEENGVSLSKKTIYSGDKIKIFYSGLLAQSGASSVFLHIGFGEKWENSTLIPMKSEYGAFSAELEVKGIDSLGVCFKDCAENWDNNLGQNYVFKISKKPLKKEKTEKSAASKVQKSVTKKLSEGTAQKSGAKKSTARKRTKTSTKIKEIITT